MATPPLRRPIAALELLLLLLLAARCATAQNSNSSGGGNNNNNNNNNNNDNPYFGATNFNPSMAIVIVVLISAFFFLGFFSIYIRQCAGDRSAAAGPAGAGGGGGANRSRRAPRGLDPALLESFPTLVYSEVKGLKVGKATLECAVCLSEFEDEETLRLLPRCSHVFHPDCIDAWLSSHVTCPVCRSDLSAAPAATEPAAADPEGPAGQDPDPELDPAPARETGHVVVEVADDHDADLEQLRRSKSKAWPPRFPRSHSTGHDLPRPAGGNPDRFTLVLPENVRREIVAAGMLRRARSMAAFPAEGSSRRGYRGGEGSSRAGGRSVRLGRSDRWPSFFLRSLSTRVQGWRRGEPDREGSVKKGEGEGSFKSGKFGAVRTPFDCLGGGASVVKVDGDGDGDGGDSESARDALAARV